MRNFILSYSIFLIVLCSCTIAIYADDNGTAAKIGFSNSTYRYNPSDVDYGNEGGMSGPLEYTQSEPEFSIITPNYSFWRFYVDGGVNYHTLKQENQEVCTDNTCRYHDKEPVPEVSIVVMRELEATLGFKIFDFLMYEYSYIHAVIQGGFYYNNKHYGVDDTFTMQRRAVIFEYLFSNWFALGFEMASIYSAEHVEEGSYMQFEKNTAFIKIIF